MCNTREIMGFFTNGIIMKKNRNKICKMLQKSNVKVDFLVLWLVLFFKNKVLQNERENTVSLSSKTGTRLINACTDTSQCKWTV